MLLSSFVGSEVPCARCWAGAGPVLGAAVLGAVVIGAVAQWCPVLGAVVLDAVVQWCSVQRCSGAVYIKSS